MGLTSGQWSLRVRTGQRGFHLVGLPLHALRWEHLGQDNWSLDVGKAPSALRSLVAWVFCSVVGGIEMNTLILVSFVVLSQLTWNDN